jgi:hypothetical protein
MNRKQIARLEAKTAPSKKTEMLIFLFVHSPGHVLISDSYLKTSLKKDPNKYEVAIKHPEDVDDTPYRIVPLTDELFSYVRDGRVGWAGYNQESILLELTD